MKTAQQLTAELGTAEAIAAFVAECEVAINQIDPDLSYQRSELSGFVRGCWPCEGFPADVAAEFVAEVRRQIDEDTTVCGNQVQYDNSGVGHNWRNIAREDIPASIVEELEGEMIDGGKDECEDFVASNGLHYRW